MLPSYLALVELDALVGQALAEDVGPGDVTTAATIGADVRAQGYFLAKADGVVAGLTAAERVFAAVDPEVRLHWTRRDGEQVTTGDVFGTVHGPAASLLVGERLALNLMQRMSGIATATHRMVQAVRPHPTKILDTRKTAPGLRLLDKWAVHLGGGTNHRIGLFDMILIKDNHIAAAGGMHAALEAAQQYRILHDPDLPIEVEADTLAKVREVVAYAERNGGVDYILLDNMVTLSPDGRVDTSMLERAIALVDGRIQTEASGNVTLATASAIAATGVDALSCGALTHSVTALDISLRFELG